MALPGNCEGCSVCNHLPDTSAGEQTGTEEAETAETETAEIARLCLIANELRQACWTQRGVLDLKPGTNHSENCRY